MYFYLLHYIYYSKCKFYTLARSSANKSTTESHRRRGRQVSRFVWRLKKRGEKNEGDVFSFPRAARRILTRDSRPWNLNWRQGRERRKGRGGQERPSERYHFNVRLSYFPHLHSVVLNLWQTSFPLTLKLTGSKETKKRCTRSLSFVVVVFLINYTLLCSAWHFSGTQTWISFQGEARSLYV